MIWVIGGTSDATTLATLLKQKGFQLLVSTTTDYGTQRIMDLDVKIVQKKLEIAEMVHLINDNQIHTVIDTSHPYAEVVSRNAIEACSQSNTKYIRYERAQKQSEVASYYPGYDEMIKYLVQTKGNILLTSGSKNIHLFRDLKERIVARVLPVEESIHQCKEAGLQAHQIIATKGRVSKETNIALMQEYQIEHLVSKDSGEAGGMKEKLEAAIDLDIDIHILERPKVVYPLVYNEFRDIIKEIVEGHK